MKFTSKQQSVFLALKKKDLTSSEILKETPKIPHILKLYSVLDELKSLGMVNSYMKEGVRYHQVA